MDRIAPGQSTARPASTRRPGTAARRRSPALSLLPDPLAHCAARAENAAPFQPDASLRVALREVLTFLGLSACALLRLAPADGALELIWRVDRTQRRREASTAGDAAGRRPRLPVLARRLARSARPVALPALAALPAAARQDRATLRALGAKAALLVRCERAPAAELVIAYLGDRALPRWPAAQQRWLAELASSLGKTVARHARRASDADGTLAALPGAVPFEPLMLKLLAGFGGAHWAQIDQQLRHALRDIRRFAGAERCELIDPGDGADSAAVLYRAGGDGDAAGAPGDRSLLTAWIHDRVVREGQPLVFGSGDGLRLGAEDAAELAQHGIGAGIFIPCLADGAVRYVLAVTDSQAHPQWSGRVMPRFAALGRLLVTAMATRALSAAHSRIQEELVAAQHFSQATLDALPEFVAVVDDRGLVVRTSGERTHADPTLAHVFDPVTVGNDYLRACESLQTSPRTQALQLVRSVRSVLAGTLQTCDMDLVVSGAQGEPRWIRCRAHRLEVGGAVHAVISHEDVTERRVRERELQQLRTHQWHSERVVQTGVIIGSLAHELSQPVTAILANAQTMLRLLARERLEPLEQRQILEDVVSDCKRAGTVIESLRIMLRRQRTERRPEDVGDIVRQVLRLMNTELISQRVEVKTRVTPRCEASVDRAQIQQVLINLIMNAIQAMPEATDAPRRLWAAVSRTRDKEILVSLRDNGVGIAPDALAQVFEAFWTTKRTGTGMGLSICRAIVEAHGGRIWARRHRVGSTFCVALPPVAQRLAG